MRWMLVASAADSLARNLDPISVDMGHDPVIIQPPFIKPERSASQPSVVLCAKTTEPIPHSLSIHRPSEKAFVIPDSKKILSL